MSEEGTRSLLHRRGIIKTVGAGVAASAVPGGTAVASDHVEVVDIVEAGADDTGTEPIDDVFADHAGDDTRIEFPEGRYRVNDLTLYGLTNFAMVGTGEAVLVPGDEYDPRTWIAGTNNRDVRVENFVIDNTGEGVGSSLTVHAYDGLVVRDVTKRGHHDAGTAAFGFRVIEADGTGTVERLRAADGGDSVGIYTDPVGEITYRDCHVELFANNGVYGSLGTGAVHVDGGLYRNNNVASVRLGAPGSTVTGATFRVDDPPDDYGNCRAVRVADGPGPVAIEDCEIRMISGRGTGGVVGAFSGGSFTVRDTAIHVGPRYTTVGSGGTRTSYAIHVDPATEAEVGSRTIEDTVITGAGDRVAPVEFARDDNELRNVCVEQSGEDRAGIVFHDSADNVVSDSTVSVPGEAIVLDGDSSVDRDGVSTDGSCAWPTEGEAVGDDGGEAAGTAGGEAGGAADAPPTDGDRITIGGGGSAARYEFTVDGDVERSAAGDAAVDDGDAIADNGTVTGRATDEPDAYAFDGVLTDFEAADDVDVAINGESVPPELIGPNVLTVVGKGETVRYEFEVTGSVAKSTAYGGTINDFDEVRSDGTVAGRTTDEADSYSCIGVASSFEAAGPVEVYADGELVTDV
ncbi:hypothetical protein [Halorubrum sp. Ea1]|uniref:hypothetical protein n=1 Tax=Halorubrum sp. Ea1 TaxID=1480718 RepID=UPI001595E423|nr:hypothetical protein [Halorubrum sp. Ea1]